MPTAPDPVWLQIIDKLGLPVCLIGFGCAIVWKLLPHVIEWFKAETTSAKAVAEAVPDMKESLHRIANEGQRKLDTLDSRTQVIEQRTEKLEDQQREILERLPKRGD